MMLSLWPYHPEYTQPHQILEVKQDQAWEVLGWETTWEYWCCRLLKNDAATKWVSARKGMNLDRYSITHSKIWLTWSRICP